MLLKISLLNTDTNIISTLHSVQSNISIGIETFIIFLVILLILNKENKMIAVIFEVQIATSKQGQYLSLASQLRPLLNNIDDLYLSSAFKALRRKESYYRFLGGKMKMLYCNGKIIFCTAKHSRKVKRAFLIFIK